ncbi:hypothetical protein TNCV_12321 [Trichonephila clavipes]|nr:hypothetical protein TNCV_12321 [Trichonephila clavipes]
MMPTWLYLQDFTKFPLNRHYNKILASNNHISTIDAKISLTCNEECIVLCVCGYGHGRELVASIVESRCTNTERHGKTEIPQPSYSPDLAPSDFWLVEGDAERSTSFNGCRSSGSRAQMDTQPNRIFLHGWNEEMDRTIEQMCSSIFVDVVANPPGQTKTAAAGSDVVQSGRPIFDDFFQHLWPYIGNNAANVVFQMVKRLWLIRIDQ